MCKIKNTINYLVKKSYSALKKGIQFWFERFGEQVKKCKCGKNDWEWQLDNELRSWIKCKSCGDNMFDKGIGVILINWDFADVNHVDIKDVLTSNKYKSCLCRTTLSLRR